MTDEILQKAFSKYTSVQKAKVIRDKRTGKTKGYGFVSFKDADEFVKAWKEMNGKHNLNVVRLCLDSKLTLIFYFIVKASMLEIVLSSCARAVGEIEILK